MYDYKKGKSNIVEILNSKTKIEELNYIPKNDSQFTYENGIKSWVGAIFIDIKDSTKLFTSEQEKVARIMRAFTSEIIEILRSDDNYRQIGIRGDCIYGIYSVPYQKDLVEIFRLAYCINTFMKMLNKILEQNNFTQITAGIGLGCNEDLIIKAGKSGTGINDKIWIGKAVVDASNLSSSANREGIGAIAMNTAFYDNIIKILKEENDAYESWIEAKRKNSSYYYKGDIEFYYCDIINSDFNNWINGGMN